MKKIFTLIIIMIFVFSCSKNQEIKNTETKSEKTKKILALWDSLTAWYSLDIKNSYPYKLKDILEKNWYKYEVINAWVSWDTSKNLLARIDLYKDKYELILINIWWNDALRSLDLNTLKKNIEKIIDKFGENKIVLFSIDLPANYGQQYRNKLKNIYQKISQEKNIYFYWQFFEGLDYKTNFLADWIHPDKSWYEIIAKNIYNYLLENKIITND